MVHAPAPIGPGGSWAKEWTDERFKIKSRGRQELESEGTRNIDEDDRRRDIYKASSLTGVDSDKSGSE